MNEWKELIMALVRHLLTGIGMLLTGHGAMTAERWDQWTTWIIPLAGLLMTLVGAIWSAKNAKQKARLKDAGKMPVPRGVLPLFLLAALALGSGCASRDGKAHWPITGVSVHKAYALAEADGWTRVDEAIGERKWVRGEVLTDINTRALTATNMAMRLQARGERSLMAEQMGKTDDQIVNAYNAGGVTWARIGDGLLTTALTAAAVWGGYQIDASTSDSGTGNTTYNMYNAAGGNQQVASGSGQGGINQTADGGANTSGEGNVGNNGGPDVYGKGRK